jgi:hypothetical protein
MDTGLVCVCHVSYTLYITSVTSPTPSLMASVSELMVFASVEKVHVTCSRSCVKGFMKCDFLRWEAVEDRIMRSFIACTLHRILFF